jgi:exoribonuclease R
MMQEFKTDHNDTKTIMYGNKMTNFNGHEAPPTHLSLYSLDSDERLHLELIPGILKLSSKQFKTTKTSGYIMKEFESAFRYLPTFMVKTNKLKDYTDKYVIVRVSHIYDRITKHRSITGVVDRYIGDVGNEMTEKELCKIISTAHWSRNKIDKSPCFSDNKCSESVRLAEFQKIGIMFEDQTPIRYDMSECINILTVSVDPDGSKDIDDAISIECMDGVNIRIGIHISDPSSWVIEGSDIDKEVAKRTESVYLRDQTFHMFPEYLSTSIFSLVSDRINRAFSVLLELSNDKDSGEWSIVKKTVTKTFLRIDRNMTYDQFQTEQMTNSKMRLLYTVGNYMYNKFLNPQQLVPYDSKKMIEIFMVLANCTVAEQMVYICSVTGLNTYPILIRSQKPSGYVFEHREMNDPRLIDEHVKLHMLSAEIRYYSRTTQNNEKVDNSNNRHNSLGLNLYTHFTSPIRRYSDILVHRIMWNLLTYVHENHAHKFKLICLEHNDLHQIFCMNHYKQFYKRVYRLENDIKITHNYINTVGKDLMNRVHELDGIIIDIISDHVHKIKIKCVGMCRDPEFTNDLFQNTIHTLTISTEQHMSNGFELFKPIRYKVCYLARDVRKIRAFL